MNVKSVKEFRQTTDHPALKKVDRSCGIVIVSVDPNGREFLMPLEFRKAEETTKWVEALNDLHRANLDTGGN